jgi:putative addiction module component, TIGR02574 family
MSELSSEDIWDSIAAEAPETLGLSHAQKAELNRRVAAHHADPSSAISWEQVRAKLFPINPNVGVVSSRS